MEKTRFSIIIPTYNSSKEVKQAILSIKKQTYKSYEIIVVDDCSTDDTYEQLSKEENIKLIRNETNLKAGGARNRGLDIANGEYVIFLDADDFLAEDDTLKKVNELIGKDIPDMVYLGFEKANEPQKRYIPTEESVELAVRIKEWKYPNVWDICWSKEFLTKNNITFVEKKYYEDFHFYYKGLIKANNVKVAPFVTHIYKNKTDSITATTNIQKLQDLFINVVEILEELKPADEYKKGQILTGMLEVITNSERLLKEYSEDLNKKNNN